MLYFIDCQPLGLTELIDSLFSVGIISFPTLAYATPHLPKLSKGLYFSKEVVVKSDLEKLGTLLFNIIVSLPEYAGISLTLEILMLFELVLSV